MRLNSDADFVKELSEDEENQKVFNTEKKIAYNDGVQSGIEQEKIETVKNFYELGIPLETIAKGTNLSLEEVKKILEEK